MSAGVSISRRVKLSALDGVVIEARYGGTVGLVLQSMGLAIPRTITPDQARQLAAALIEAAGLASAHG